MGTWKCIGLASVQVRVKKSLYAGLKTHL